MRFNRLLMLPAAIGVLAFGVAACGDSGGTGSGDNASGASNSGKELSGTIKIDGSSTVGPLTEAAAEMFQQQYPGVRVTVGTSGTGGGFEKFCAGETDISDASRPIKPEEESACQAKNIKYDHVQVANDGLSVVVNKQNDWAKCLTVPQLQKFWDKGSKLSNWSQVDPKFPDQKISLFGAGTDSGTFDYFTGAINGEEGRSRTDYQATEDDNVTVQGVSGDKGGLGYFGLSYYEQNKDKLTDVQINGGDGCVSPNTQTVQDGTYKPLSRPLFIYPNDKALARPEVKAFVDFYIKNQADLTKQALFVPMTPEQLKKAQDNVAALAAK
jgi:phosphate transport system substrate-binding protein